MFVRLYQDTKQRVKPSNLITATPKLCLVHSPTYLYHGFVQKSIKHGEGVLMTRTGYLLIGRWVRDQMHGRALIITPFGGKLYATLNEGKLSGWCITVWRNKVITCAEYFQNRLSSNIITYELTDQLWVSGKYSRRHELVCLTHAEQGAMDKLPSFVQSVELQQMYSRCIVQRKQYFSHSNIVEEKDINERVKYVGLVNADNHPSSIGLMYSDEEMFYGYFEVGILEHYGRMLFANGQIYHGQLSKGVFLSEGFYYRPSNNTSTIVESADGVTVPKVSVKGYNLPNLSVSLGVEIGNGEVGVNFDAVNKIAAGIEQYYLKEFLNTTGHLLGISGVSEEYMSMAVEQSPLKHRESPSVSFKADSFNNSSPQKKKNQKWLDFIQKGNQHKDGQQKDSLNKNNQQFLKDNYQTNVIRQNNQPQEKEAFKKQIPKQSMIKNQFIKEDKESLFVLDTIQEEQNLQQQYSFKQKVKEKNIQKLLQKSKNSNKRRIF